MKKTLFASFSNLSAYLFTCMHLLALPVFVSQTKHVFDTNLPRWQGASAKINAFCFVIKHRTYSVFTVGPMLRLTYCNHTALCSDMYCFRLSGPCLLYYCGNIILCLCGFV